MSRDESEFRIHGVAPLSADECVLVLEQVDGAHLLPIHTGTADAQALALEIAGITRTRPLTHDLLLTVLEATGWKVKRVLVSDVRDGIFYAKIFLEKDGEERAVDARPSDALNVAARAHCPIHVAHGVLAVVRPVLKPVADEERARFREQLERADLATVFAELEGKPAPRELGDEAPRTGTT